MTLQIIFAIYTLLCIVVCVAALIAIWRSEWLTWKPLWALGSLAGFVGLGIDWANPDDLYLQFGVQIPVVMTSWFASGQVAAKALFPIIALVAIGRVRGLHKDMPVVVFGDDETPVNRP